MNAPRLTVSDFINACNQTLDYAYSNIQIIGEVASFKVNQGKWVFFDLKDESSSLNCFMPLWNLRMPLEDGMKVIVSGTPKLTKWGKFSITVKNVMPLGEGNLKKSFELLKQKLTAEGLFDPAKKRPLPIPLTRIGVISSTDAAGYADFIKIIGERWGGLTITVANTGVQGLEAADQIIRALKYFNEHTEVEVIAIVRGGGSKDDLAVFNDEKLVRAIAASRIPIITGIGHEVDESLADLAADLRASTPSNAAEFLTPDRHAVAQTVSDEILGLVSRLESEISVTKINIIRVFSIKNLLFDKFDLITSRNHDEIAQIAQMYVVKITTLMEKLQSRQKVLAALNPEKILSHGYAILSGKISPGETLKITTIDKIITTEIKNVKARN